MTTNYQHEILDQIVEAADAVVRVLVTAPRGQVESAGSAIERMAGLGERYCRDFPVLRDEVEFWETLWRRTNVVRMQWLRIERTAGRAGVHRRIQPVIDGHRQRLYHWIRRFICDHAPTVPLPGHFELGIDTRRSDYRGLHERIEGLYESIKRAGKFPTIRENITPPTEGINFALIHGCGWTVSSYSVLREAARVDGVNGLVAFDHPGSDLYRQVGRHTVRVATAGMLWAPDRDKHILATFREPIVIHFACPHEWTGPTPQELGLPILRCELTLEIVDDKAVTTRALDWYSRNHGADLPLIREWSVERPSIPVEIGRAGQSVRDRLSHLEAAGIHEIIVKPCERGEEEGVNSFALPAERSAAIDHAVQLLLESNVVIQERICPSGKIDFNWRVFVALTSAGEPKAVGRFARIGHGDQMEFVSDRQMLSRCGISGTEATKFLDRLDAVAEDAFRAVAAYAADRHADYPWQPLGGGSYTVPYFLGVDLIDDARIIEVNGNEVAGMWSDDRLYPSTRGRSSRTLLESARAAGAAYKAVLENAKCKM